MKKKTILFSTVLFLGMDWEKSFAQSVLLTIDDSNPSAITITATGLNSSANSSSTLGRDGVDLLGFFSANESSLAGFNLPNSTLMGGNSGAYYDACISDNYSTGGAGYIPLDLDLYADGRSPGYGNTQAFSTTQPAFTGSWTFDFAGWGGVPSTLPAAGSQGSILSGYSLNPGVVIGDWQVIAVPEPSTGALLAVGLLSGAALWRKRAVPA